jgi:C-terminal processing protease CtpA/Prc
MKRLWILMLAALLQACGGGGGGGSSASGTQACSVADQRAQVLQFMTNEYLWYQQLATPDPNAATMDAYFQSMLYRPVDRFSYTEPTSAYQQLFDAGTFTGYGYTLTVVDPTNAVLRVRSVEPQGPAYGAGLRRGDTIIDIDGFTPAQVLAGAAGSVGAAGVTRTMHVRDTAGNVKSLQMVSATFPLTTVREVSVLNSTRNGVPIKVGYIDYTQFVSYSENDLIAAVSSFAAQGASELVLDLRYNGGGDVATARDLASLIAGARVAGQVFASLRFNDKNQAKNQTILFNAPPTATPNLSRVVIIASASTASASELVINGLKPFMGVVLIGRTTYGKPYGFEPFDYCGTVYNAVNFESVNALGVGGYTSGIPPTCPVADDLDHQLGDPNERELAGALTYISTGVCPPASQIPQSPQMALQQVPQGSVVRVAPTVLGDVTMPGMFRRR